MRGAANRRKNRAGWLAMPMLVWSAIFVGAAILYIIALSFLKRNPDGDGVVLAFTLENYAKLMQPGYAKVFVRTLKLAVETTLLCVLIGYPFGLLMARAKGRARTLLLLLVIVPFWTNALVRIYGWRILLMGTGVVNKLLTAMGLIDKPLKLINTHGAVVLGMVYGPIPFMILSTYSSAEKLDRGLTDAGRDLGAKPWRVFLTVELPLTLPGLMSGGVLVFVPLYEAMAASSSMNSALLLSLFIIMPLTLLLIYLFAGRMAKPLRQMKDVAISMSEGDYQVRANDEQRGEMGQLARSLNHLSQELYRNIS